MTSTKLIIAALMVPVFTLTALVMAAAAVARSVGRALADNVLLGTGRHPEVINSVPVGGSSWAQPATSEEASQGRPIGGWPCI